MKDRLKINANNFYRFSPYIILLLLIIPMSILNEQFLTLPTFINMMRQVSTVGIVALGAMVVIITGGIDFSAGFGIAMIGMAAGTIFYLTDATQSVWVLIAVCVFGGALLGLVNGLIVTKLKIVPFIATLGTMSIAQGASVLIGGGSMTSLARRGDNFLWLGQGMLFNLIPVPFVVFVIVSCTIYVLLNKTKFGVYTYSMGSNEEAIKYEGINIARYKTMVYVVAGTCTGIAALITSMRIAMVSPNMAGVTILLDAIAATVLGGTSILGGRGRVSGTIAGAFIIVVISMALTYFAIASDMQELFKGVVIFIAVGIDGYINKYAAKATRY